MSNNSSGERRGSTSSSSGCVASGDSDLDYHSGSEQEEVMLMMNGLDSDPDSDGERASSPGEFTDESSSGIMAGEGDSMKSDDGEEEEQGVGKEGNITPVAAGEAGANSNAFYFEGVEKLLEIWFSRLDGKMGESCSLRRIPRYQLEEMLKLVHCEIIDSVSNDEIDSYVLSESSLFVSQRRLILKTCGTTTPLQCLKFLWTLVQEYTGFDCIEDVYYSHKNYKRPQMQKLPYRKFDSEVQLLDEFFHGADSSGSAYCLGSLNRDCWYLYTYHHPTSQNQKYSAGILSRLGGGQCRRHHHQPHHHSQLGHHNGHHHHHQHQQLGRKNHRRAAGVVVGVGVVGGNANNGSGAGRIAKNSPGNPVIHYGIPLPMVEVDEPDQTLEILMSDLEQGVMDIFTRKECKTAAEATLKSGIHRIIPGMIINDHLFEPCGYSMNGIIKDPLRSKQKSQGTYMTIHITPESEFSYVSFETNIALTSYKEMIGRVVDIFRPGKFVLTFFANKVSKGYPAHQEMNKMEGIKDHWLRMDNQFCRLEKHDLTYAMYTKFPS